MMGGLLEPPPASNRVKACLYNCKGLRDDVPKDEIVAIKQHLTLYFRSLLYLRTDRIAGSALKIDISLFLVETWIRWLSRRQLHQEGD